MLRFILSPHFAMGRAVAGRFFVSFAGVTLLFFITSVLIGSLSVAPSYAVEAIDAVEATDVEVPHVPLTPLESLRSEIQDRLAAKFKTQTTSRFHKINHGALVEFYNERDHAPIWVDEYGLMDQARQVIGEIHQAKSWGLDPQAYDLPELKRVSKAGELTIEWLSAVELKMSHAVLSYARHASGGRVIPTRLSRNFDFQPFYVDPRDVMVEMAKGINLGVYLQSLHPRHTQFLRLKEKLAQLRGANQLKKKPIVYIPNGPVFRPGARHSHIALIRKRLDHQDPAASDLEKYDDALAEAVRAFQKKNDLKVEAIIGPATRRAMNRVAKKKSLPPIDKILVNMERWRWMAGNLGSSYVNANIPEFKVRFVEDGKAIFTERIVAGKLSNPTPIFSDKIEHVVFNPYWYPPRSIVVKEIIPGALKSSNFITRHRLQISNVSGRKIDPNYVDWRSDQARSLYFRQPPGKGNVLGVVKFVFPNKHQVYMHDTPTKSLFNKRVRAYSHGCMRVKNPMKLAELLLADSSDVSRARIDRVVRSGDNYRFNLAKKIPVHVTYFTAHVGDDGELRTFSDIYGHDPYVSLALKGRYSAIRRPAPQKKAPPKKKSRTFNPFWSFWN